MAGVEGGEYFVDIVSPERRSEIMRKVRSKNTSAEWVVRHLVHSLGYRYRLHRRDLPGKPDLVFAGRKKVMYVHGCFWHAHEGCKRARVPEANRDYWRAKIERNAQRDAAHMAALTGAGWQVMVIWECELRDVVELEARIREFLDG